MEELEPETASVIEQLGDNLEPVIRFGVFFAMKRTYNSKEEMREALRNETMLPWNNLKSLIRLFASRGWVNIDRTGENTDECFGELTEAGKIFLEKALHSQRDQQTDQIDRSARNLREPSDKPPMTPQQRRLKRIKELDPKPAKGYNRESKYTPPSSHGKHGQTGSGRRTGRS